MAVNACIFKLACVLLIRVECGYVNITRHFSLCSLCNGSNDAANKWEAYFLLCETLHIYHELGCKYVWRQ